MRLLTYALLSGITMFFGAILARFLRLGSHAHQDILQHTSVAIGGGILSASVAFVLIPHGVSTLGPISISVSLLIGALSFAYLDRKISAHGGSKAQVLAMLMDYIPEVIALGATFSHDPKMGLMLAVFMGLQNFPEGFNAYGELRRSISSSTRVLCILFMLSFAGLLPTLLGAVFLSKYPALISGLMIYASGGILYLVFQDIIPMASMKRTWIPALGGVVGYLVGVMGFYFFH